MIKKKYVYGGYGITFDSWGSWSFDNGAARNVIIFDVDSSLSSHADNRKNNFLILGLSPTYGINGKFCPAEKHLVLILLNQIQNFAWVYIIMMTIVICLLMEKK